MTKIAPLTDLVDLQNEASAVSAINANNAKIETALTNTLSRDGSAPNQMGALLDMNSNKILNLPAPSSNNEPLRFQDLATFNGGGTLSAIPAGGTTGQLLTKKSGIDYDTDWENTIVPVGGTIGQVLTKKTNADLDMDWENGTVVNTASEFIGGQITLTPNPLTQNGVLVGTNNVSAIEQKDRTGAYQNIAYYDNDDDLFIGPLGDNGRNTIFTTNPINLLVRHVFWDFNENVLPPGLTGSNIGNGCTFDPQGESRININTRNIAAGDGGLLMANNILTRMDRPTRVYFVLNFGNAEDRNTDLQFGLRDAAGVNRLNFSYTAPSGGHSTIFANIANGTPHNIDTTVADITGRHTYLIEFTAGGNVNFWIGNNINQFVLRATFLNSDSSLPSAGANLLPYVQMRTNDAPAARTLMLDSIYSIFAW